MYNTHCYAEAADPDAPNSKSEEAAAPKAETATTSTDPEALQLNQLPTQSAPTPSQQPSEQPKEQASAKTSAAAKDSNGTATQQQQPASNASATKAAGQEQKQQAESSAKQGSAAASSAGGAWGGAKSFRDIAAGNKPEQVCTCFSGAVMDTIIVAAP